MKGCSTVIRSKAPRHLLGLQDPARVYKWKNLFDLDSAEFIPNLAALPMSVKSSWYRVMASSPGAGGGMMVMSAAAGYAILTFLFFARFRTTGSKITNGMSEFRVSILKSVSMPTIEGTRAPLFD